MSDYVNKINSAGKEYDIRDSRVEGLEAAIAGKADSSSVEELRGELALMAVPSGGVKLYKHTMSVSLAYGGSVTNTSICFISTDSRSLASNETWEELSDKANCLLDVTRITTLYSSGLKCLALTLQVVPPSTAPSFRGTLLSTNESVTCTFASDTPNDTVTEL